MTRLIPNTLAMIFAVLISASLVVETTRVPVETPATVGTPLVF